MRRVRCTEVQPSKGIASLPVAGVDSTSLDVTPASLDAVITQASQECLQMFFWNSAARKSISCPVSAQAAGGRRRCCFSIKHFYESPSNPHTILPGSLRRPVMRPGSRDPYGSITARAASRGPNNRWRCLGRGEEDGSVMSFETEQKRCSKISKPIEILEWFVYTTHFIYIQNEMIYSYIVRALL